MPNKLLLKKSSVTSKVPLTTDLDYGELAINYADEKLYFKNSLNQIKSFSVGGGGGGGGTAAIDFETYTATSGQTTFNVAYTAPFVNVYLNGVRLSDADYTATNGTSVTLSIACALNDVVNLVGFTSLSIAGSVTSVAATVPSFLSISGSPITTSGTLAIGLSGTALPAANGGTGATSLAGASIATYAGTETLTNKRITPRVISTASASTLTPSIASGDIFVFTALAANLAIEAPTGSPVDGDKITIRILDNGTTRTLTWNATYTPISVTLPTATTPNKTTYVGCIYNANNTRWDVIAVATQA